MGCKRSDYYHRRQFRYAKVQQRGVGGIYGLSGMLGTTCRIRTYRAKKGLKIHVKPVPETDRPGVVDPRAANWFRNLPKGYQVQDYRRITSEEVQILRDAMGCQNADLSRGVKTNRRTINTENGDVPILIYTPDISGTLPLICYIHGGGFFGGSTEVVENAVVSWRSGQSLL
jgi:acetyl esterase/lipase